MAATIIQYIISGLAIGFIYALVGIEYTLIWNSSGLLNFSHDKLITLGAYVFAGSMVIHLHLAYPIAIFLTFLVMGLFGAVVAQGIFNPLRNMRSNIFAIMGTMLLGRIIAEAIRLIWGPVPFTLPGYMTGAVNIGIAYTSKSNLYIMFISVIVVIALQLFMTYTKTGKAMRCVSQNKKASALMGINVTASICITTAISAVICTVIAILVIPLFNVTTTLDASIGLKGFSAGVIGGFGYLPGAIAGGLFIGVVENLSVLFLPAVYKDVVSFALLILFLVARPGGFFGKRA